MLIHVTNDFTHNTFFGTFFWGQLNSQGEGWSVKNRQMDKHTEILVSNIECSNQFNWYKYISPPTSIQKGILRHRYIVYYSKVHTRVHFNVFTIDRAS